MGDKLNERNSARRKFMRSAGTLGLAGFFGGQAVSGFADNRKRKPEKHDEIEGLERLGELYKKGLLTKEEFDKKKGELLDDEDH